MAKYCIDPGHGGNDSGAVGPRQLHEADVNLDIAKRAGKYLIAQGHDVIYTRFNDSFIELGERAAIANRAGVDYFISFHENSYTDPTVNGTETYCYKTGGAGEKLAAAIQTELVAALKLADRGVKTADFAVLRLTKMPAALIETSFISNPDQEIKLMQAEYKEQAALAIAKGIIKGTGQVWQQPTAPSIPPVQPVDGQAPDGQYFKIQVGAYKSRAGAEELLAKIKAAGFDGFIKLE